MHEKSTISWLYIPDVGYARLETGTLKDVKSDLAIRPIFHQEPERIGVNVNQPSPFLLG